MTQPGHRLDTQDILAAPFWTEQRSLAADSDMKVNRGLEQARGIAEGVCLAQG